MFFANQWEDGRISSLLLLGHSLGLNQIGPLRLESGFLALTSVLWLGPALVSLLTFCHLRHPPLVTNLARLFSGLGRGRNDLGGRRLLNRSWRKHGFLSDISEVLGVEDVLDSPLSP